MKDYLLTLKVQNNYLHKMMEAKGFKNAAELSRASGVAQTQIGFILNLKKPAYNKVGNLSASVAALCDFFLCEVGDIFPEEHIYNPLEEHIFKAEYAYQENLLEGDGMCPSLLLEQEDKFEVLTDFIDKLPPRDKKIIEMHFGINGEDRKTFKEIAELFGVTACRVMQIQDRALRKLRKSYFGNIWV